MVKNKSEDTLASSMDQVLSSAEYKDMFSSAEMLKKLAFKRVSEENDVTEIEKELEKTELKSEAQDYACKGCKNAYIKDKPGPCHCTSVDECVKGCGCHNFPPKPNTITFAPEHISGRASLSAGDELIVIASNTLLKASEELEEAGLGELSARSLSILSELIVEAKKRKGKGKVKPKAKSKKEDKKTTEKDSKKSTDKKTTEDKKSTEKDTEKKSS